MKLILICVLALMRVEASATKIQVAFSPNGGATDLVVQTINSAHSMIPSSPCVFTNASISSAGWWETWQIPTWA
jgi:hypothetical protein